MIIQMFSLLYSFLYSVSFIIYLPKLLLLKKYRKSWKERLGITHLQNTASTPNAIWVHAVSVGETSAVSSLVKELQKRYPDRRIIVSNVTETGFQTAKRLLPDVTHHFLPFDFAFSVRKFLNHYRPSLIILTETDFWWRFLSEAKKRGATIALVNGKMSPRSCQRFSFIPFFSRRLFSLIDVFCVQSEEEKTRFAKFTPKEITVTGNLKGDVRYPITSSDELQKNLDLIHKKNENFLLVIGSTHAPEEKILLSAITPLVTRYPTLQVLIVPRHPERFSEVQALIEKIPVATALWSQLPHEKPPRIILGDAMGKLTLWYQMADAAIVAGSFTNKVGGHNILEPLFYNKPTLCGPYMHSQKELFTQALAQHAIIPVTEQDVATHISHLIEDLSTREGMQHHSTQFLTMLHGSLERTLGALS